MAAIYKTYTDSYSDYKEFKTWADRQTLTFFNGHKVCIGNWVWDYEKEDFDGGERPIMNTPTWLDIYLIQNCKSVFVLNRMKTVYGEKSLKEFQSIDLTSPPSGDFKQNRKITIKKSDRTKFPLHKKPYGGKTKLDGTIHPTQKPIALLEMLVKSYTNEGDMVLDNTTGSGTTNLACIKLNRKSIGIEKEKQYYDVAVRRASEYCH